MQYIPEKDLFICAKGRQLRYAHTRNIKKKTGFVSERKVYICEPVTDVDTKKSANRMQNKQQHIL